VVGDDPGAGRHVLVQAEAGSGKSTTIEALVRQLPSHISYLTMAFNKHIEKAMNRRGVKCRTISSLGYGLVRDAIPGIRFDPAKAKEKHRRILHRIMAAVERSIDRRLGKSAPPDRIAALKDAAVDGFERLVDLAANACIDPDDPDAIASLARHHGINADDLLRPDNRVAEYLSETERIAVEERTLTFLDMIYLPWRWNLEARRRYDLICVDEAQDLSRLKAWIVLRFLRPGGRSLWVGDRAQSIYGFCGADAASMDNIKAMLGAREMPLSLSYRLPKSHVRLVRSHSPTIEAAADAIEGEIRWERADDLCQFVRPGDLVLSRKLAPLVPALVKLIRAGFDAVIRGDRISPKLIQIVKAVSRVDDFHMDEFGICLERYRRERVKGMSGSVKAAFEDLCEAIECVWLDSRDDTLDGFCRSIEWFFGRSPSAESIVLSSVHKAKGLEGDRVVVLYPEQMPLVWPGQQEWEKRQEENVRHVAFTRSRHTLILASG